MILFLYDNICVLVVIIQIKKIKQPASPPSLLFPVGEIKIRHISYCYLLSTINNLMVKLPHQHHLPGLDILACLQYIQIYSASKIGSVPLI